MSLIFTIIKIQRIFGIFLAERREVLNSIRHITSFVSLLANPHEVLTSVRTFMNRGDVGLLNTNFHSKLKFVTND